MWGESEGEKRWANSESFVTYLVCDSAVMRGIIGRFTGKHCTNFVILWRFLSSLLAFEYRQQVVMMISDSIRQHRRSIFASRWRNEKIVEWHCDWIQQHFNLRRSQFRTLVSCKCQRIDLKTDWEDFDFFHCEITFTSENMLPVNSCVIHMCISKICAIIIVLVTAVRDTYVIAVPNIGPYDELHKIACNDFHSENFLASLFRWVLSGLYWPRLGDSHATGVRPPKMKPLVVNIIVRKNYVD
jgi:hypothetical protein